MTHLPDVGDDPPKAARSLTLGEYRVGITFNPSNNPHVDEIKSMAARLIDACEAHRHARPPGGSIDDRAELNRLLSLASTHIEIAAMWAVKAVTKLAR